MNIDQKHLLAFMVFNRIVVLVVVILMFVFVPEMKWMAVAILVIFAIDTVYRVKRIKRMQTENDRSD